MKTYRNVLILILSLNVCLICSVPSAKAWEINFQFNMDDIKSRNVGKVLVGAVASIAVHETGHYVAGKLVGMDTEYTWANGPAVNATNFNDRNETEQAIFAVAGMMSQALVGTVLTNVANDSDYTLGFNATAALENLSYPLRNKPGSDWKYMPHGKLVAFTHGLYSTGLTLINLNLLTLARDK